MECCVPHRGHKADVLGDVLWFDEGFFSTKLLQYVYAFVDVTKRLEQGKGPYDHTVNNKMGRLACSVPLLPQK